MTTELTIETLLSAYAAGYFPMGESRDDPKIAWYYPERRGIIPLDGFHIPRGLKKVIKKQPYDLRVNGDFHGVMTACASVPRHEDGSWINDTIINAYCALQEAGYAHSVEAWHEGRLVGGLYGVSLGGAFFGESMFSLMSEASKMALVTLVEILREAGYTLLDTQFVNAHLLQFGAVEISRRAYKSKLHKALQIDPNPSSLFSTVSVRRGLASASSVR